MNTQNNIFHQAADNQSKPAELSEQQLDQVVGGTVKKVDHVSAKLFNACAGGVHIKTATLTA